MSVLRGVGLGRRYGSGQIAVEALAGVDVEVRAGRLTVVRGPSGSGKTTLLNLLGGLDRPTSGRVLLGDDVLSELSEAELAAARRDRIGYVFQNFGLIPVLSAAENVEVPLRLRRMERGQRDERVAEVLELVGLIRHAGQRPGELSGGQQQRVGVARALVARPEVLIADEPTGQLDSETAERIMDLILEVTRIRGTATVVATHDPLLISRADEVLELRDGRVVAGHPG
ncbi:ABC transporter ATP-binding protein [Arachnia propionica]|jgi:ABC transporter related|uniref:ABC transporter ATP-binding protein n=1 Tax=Arachnia propionica TaxID=1750 RepID=A0AB37HW60_9ACTN|nr:MULTISPECIES: ABC transporter ATP-binding protein [Arachnia]AFN47644.1 ABC transporter, ATP-binding protein [Arachnia propionica F0230a]QCT38622.1 ABC transporter ATP-binding protein [Arachnia propionica]QUC11775.1 ABC transporter ATP-binding protein [Arachnia propionica]RPA18596.1 ABC transporter ATP-binding protein [Arachnia propionica]